MERKIIFIENMQRLFVDAYGYSVWILDRTGKLVTCPIFSTEEGERVYETNGKSVFPLTSSLLRHGMADGPVLFDLGDSWQMVVAMLRLGPGQYYYICTGPLRMEDDKGKLIHRTAELKKLLASYLQLEQSDDKDKLRGQVLERLAEQMQQGGIEVGQAADLLTRAGLQYDFFGYAGKGENFQYKVTYTSGKWGEKLLGATLFAGEGYLGQLAVTGQANWWNCTVRDPRLRFFTELGVEPRQLFGYPVKQNGSTTGLLFYGMVQGTGMPESQLHIHWAGLLSALLGEGMTRRKLQEDLEVQLNRMRAFMEIADVLTTVRDLNRVMYLLIDMVHTLIPDLHASICLVRLPETGKVKMVSRGLPEDKADRYGKVLSYKHFQPAQEQGGALGIDAPEMRRTADSVIVHRNEVLGVICVDGGEAEPSAETVALLDVLTERAAVAIDQCIGERVSDKRAISLLYDAMLQLDPAQSALVSVGRELCGLFGRFLHLGPQELLRLDDAAALSGYETEFLRTVPIREEIMDIITGYRKLEREEAGLGDDSYPLESRMLYYAMRHVKNGRALPAAAEPADELGKQFHAFLIYREMMSRELAINGLWDDKRSPDDRGETAAGVEFAALSPREMDVLRLIADGSNNRTIAESLYISEHTVKNHITNIFGKLGVSDRSQLIAMVYRSRNHAHLTGANE